MHNQFKLTFTNPCASDTITLSSPPAAITTYSGGTLTNTAITVTHSVTPACNSYTTYLVEASTTSSTAGFTSTGAAYTDLISTSNTNLAFTLSPKTSYYDSGTATRTSYVKVSVRYTYSSSVAAATYLYTISVKPKKDIVDLADG